MYVKFVIIILEVFIENSYNFLSSQGINEENCDDQIYQTLLFLGLLESGPRLIFYSNFLSTKHILKSFLQHGELQ